MTVSIAYDAGVVYISEIVGVYYILFNLLVKVLSLCLFGAFTYKQNNVHPGNVLDICTLSDLYHYTFQQYFMSFRTRAIGDS